MRIRLLFGRYPSRCCNAQRTIVVSRRGGFVTQNCSTCGKPDPVSLLDLPRQCCQRCESELEVGTTYGNYCYRCPDCGRSWEVAQLVPHWSELLSECGYGLEGDLPVDA